VAFEKELPKWGAVGVEPPASKQTAGWQAGDKPPAEYLNWQQNRTYEALKELRAHAHTGAAGDAEKITSAGLANGAATDTVIGNRTVDDTSTPNTGPNTISNLFSFFGKMIRQITGKGGWTEAPIMTLEAVYNRFLATPSQSTANKTYYVAKTGSDSNDGSSGSPFLTIGKAVSLIPQVLNHVYTINVATGTYAETVTIAGVSGSGSVVITGTTATVSNMVMSQCTVKIIVNTVIANSTTATGFYAEFCTWVYLNTCQSTVTAAQVGVHAYGGKVIMGNCVMSNKSSAILASGMGTVSSVANTGSGNTIGLNSQEASYINVFGAQPSGITNRSGSGIISDVFVNATPGPITLYVSTTGNDSNDGLTIGTALRNIQTAINRIPQIVNHAVTINVAAGTYTESLFITGFMGLGTINLNGDTVVSGNYNINDIAVLQCRCSVSVTGFRALSTTNHNFRHNGSMFTLFDRCSSIVSSPFSAFLILTAGSCSVLGCLASNHSNAMAVDGAALAISSTWNGAGSGNNTGLAATFGKISKVNAQPSGATAEFTVSGGQIL
jgi:hypothetical protein